MIIPVLLSISWQTILANDTVWWNTPGGTVTEHRDQSGASCSLMFYDRDGSVVFDWDKMGSTHVTAVDWNWQLPEGWHMPVAMQLGDVWLSNGGNSAIIQAVGHGNAVNFQMDQHVDDLLRTADHVVVKTTYGELSVHLNKAKTAVLLTRTGLCRTAIGR